MKDKLEGLERKNFYELRIKILENKTYFKDYNNFVDMYFLIHLNFCLIKIV